MTKLSVDEREALESEEALEHAMGQYGEPVS
jgi:hypothetical protein